MPVAKAGIRVIGVDASAGMLEVARDYAKAEGVEALLDLRLGDMREPPVEERVPLVLIPFRSLLHMTTEADRLRALAAANELLLPGGRLSSTSSRRAARTSRTPTAAGSSASRGSSSAPTGTRASAR